MIGVGFKILGRTPVPKLPPSYPAELRRKVGFPLTYSDATWLHTSVSDAGYCREPPQLTIKDNDR